MKLTNADYCFKVRAKKLGKGLVKKEVWIVPQAEYEMREVIKSLNDKYSKQIKGE